MDAIQNFTCFIGAWLLYLVFQACIINGIKLSASGSTEILPDGTEKDSEMILYPLAKFLLKKMNVKVAYKGTQLALLYTNMMDWHKTLSLLNIDLDKNVLNCTTLYPVEALQADKAKIEDRFGIKILISGDTLILCKEFEHYRFPAIIRKPIIQCIVCMASFWGLLTCLVPALILFGFDYRILIFYGANTLALACVNKIVFKYTT